MNVRGEESRAGLGVGGRIAVLNKAHEEGGLEAETGKRPENSPGRSARERDGLEDYPKCPGR